MAPRDFDPDVDAWRGDPNGPLTAVVYSDFTCPACRRAMRSRDAVMGRVIEHGVFVYRHLPARSRAPESERAALAALAAKRQGAYWEMHERLFGHTDFSEEAMRGHAEAIGLDLDRFETDLADPELGERLQRDLDDAARAGARATPSLFLNGRHYDGPWDPHAVMEAAERPVAQRLSAAFSNFFNWAAAGGLVLILATLAALFIANIGFHEGYERLRETELAISFGAARFGLSLEAWINDALMAVFFLLVGIEIKRELIDGELSDPASAALPLLGALGGMAAPALIYAAFNAGGPAAHGWGVPMATDIAFTIGLMALMGERVPASLKIFVSALAVADDLGAIIVIALFYGEGFHLGAFLAALLALAAMIGLNRARVYARAPYILAGIALWCFLQESGLHATLAGVLTAAAIPSRPRGHIAGIAAQTAALLETGQADGHLRGDLLSQLYQAIDRLREPSYHLERRLQGVTNFMILPLFAFFNTGILLGGGAFSIAAPETLGVMLGLMVGKPLGIVGLSLLSVRLGWARLPTGASLRQMIGAGCLAGVGFTMSIFIATAAFSGAQLEAVKLSVLLASLLSATIGMAILWRAAPAAAEARAEA